MIVRLIGELISIDRIINIKAGIRHKAWRIKSCQYEDLGRAQFKTSMDEVDW